MRLATKFTLSFALFVIILSSLSMWVIHFSTERQFDTFIKQKESERLKWDMEQEKIPRARVREFLDQHPELKAPNLGSDQGVPVFRPPLKVDSRFAPDSPEDAFLSATRKSILFTACIGLLLALLVGYFLSHHFFHRLEELRAAMVRYRDKNERHEVREQGDDEIHDVAKTYNLLLKELDKQDRIRRDFFVDITHELKTPITSLKGYLEGLIDGVFADPKKIYTSALKETDRMGRLVGTLTKLARCESGEAQFQKSRLDLLSLVRDVVEMFSARIQEVGAQVSVDGKGSVYADKDACIQIVSNLLDNALSHGTSPHDISLEISDAAKGYISLKVRNEASGLTQEDVSMLTERLYKADKGRAFDQADPHLGLGLSIVKKIVEGHGGTLAIEYRDSRLTITVLLPATPNTKQV